MKWRRLPLFRSSWLPHGQQFYPLLFAPSSTEFSDTAEMRNSRSVTSRAINAVITFPRWCISQQMKESSEERRHAVSSAYFKRGQYRCCSFHEGINPSSSSAAAADEPRDEQSGRPRHFTYSLLYQRSHHHFCMLRISLSLLFIRVCWRSYFSESTHWPVHYFRLGPIQCMYIQMYPFLPMFHIPHARAVCQRAVKLFSLWTEVVYWYVSLRSTEVDNASILPLFVRFWSIYQCKLTFSSQSLFR